MKYAQEIKESEYIGDSLYNLNANFDAFNSELLNLSKGVSSFEALQDYVALEEARLNSIYNIVENTFIPSLVQVRLSLDSTITTSSNTTTNTIYLHPYNGNLLSVYNTVTKRWEVESIENTQAIPLVNLELNQIYDVVVYKENKLMFSFIKWQDFTLESYTNNDGKVESNIFHDKYTTNRVLIDNVLTVDSKRLLGTIHISASSANTIHQDLQNTNTQVSLSNLYNKIQTVCSFTESIEFVTCTNSQAVLNVNTFNQTSLFKNKRIFQVVKDIDSINGSITHAYNIQLSTGLYKIEAQGIDSECEIILLN